MWHASACKRCMRSTTRVDESRCETDRGFVGAVFLSAGSDRTIDRHGCRGAGSFKVQGTEDVLRALDGIQTEFLIVTRNLGGALW